jgi:hypothetical protein
MYTLTHKKQTKLNDCWYACIQMIKSHRFGAKVKPMGSGVRNHRTGTLLGRSIWGHALGGDDTEFDNILTQNNLKEIKGGGYSSILTVKNSLQLNGPLIFGGEFGTLGKNIFTGNALIRAGHYIVVVGVDEARQILVIHDPDKADGPTEMPFAEFDRYVWKKNQQTVIANDGGYLLHGITRSH